jgi:glucose-6-phosphate 1-epimerase
MDFVELVSAGGRARISCKGAQVCRAELGARPLLWCSPDAGMPVRGGVPICFPWFGKHPEGLPAHGFARLRDWQLLDQAADRALFGLDDDADTLALWPHRFHAEMAISLDDVLNFTFTVTNIDAAPIRFTYALHTYFAVDSLAEATVAFEQRQASVTLDDRIDAVFEDAPGRLVLRDGERRVAIDSPEMTSAVIWNPGDNDAPDIGDQWRNFVCVERGRIGAAAVTLDPDERHASSMRLSLI